MRDLAGFINAGWEARTWFVSVFSPSVSCLSFSLKVKSRQLMLNCGRIFQYIGTSSYRSHHLQMCWNYVTLSPCSPCIQLSFISLANPSLTNTSESNTSLFPSDVSYSLSDTLVSPFTEWPMRCTKPLGFATSFFRNVSSLNLSTASSDHSARLSPTGSTPVQKRQISKNIKHRTNSNTVHFHIAWVCLWMNVIINIMVTSIAVITVESTGKAYHVATHDDDVLSLLLLTAACRRGYWVNKMEHAPPALFLCSNR